MGIGRAEVDFFPCGLRLNQLSTALLDVEAQAVDLPAGEADAGEDEDECDDVDERFHDDDCAC